MKKASADLDNLPVNDKNIIKIIGEDNSKPTILQTIEHHGDAIEKDVKHFVGTV